MKVTVKLFAGLAEQASRSEVDVELTAPATVAELRSALKKQIPALAAGFSRALFAVNRRYAEDSTTIEDQDEIALIPPVSGGSPDSDQPTSRIITRDPLDPAAALRALSDPNCGGTVVFSGTVREWTRNRQSLYLEYEAYVDMALGQMKVIEDDIKTRWPDVATLQWHRVGQLFPTDIAVICAAAAPHRDTAFAAARELIERLKKEVPIWKKEFFADGQSTWQATP